MFRYAMAALLVSCARPSNPAPGPLEVGVASVPLDVPIGVSLGGYGRARAADEPGSSWAEKLPASRGLHSQPTAAAMAFFDGLTEVVLVRVELCLVTSSLRLRAERHLRERGIRASLLVAATHTHSAPGRFFRPVYTDGASHIDVPARAMDVYDAEVEDRLARSIAEAAALALSSRKQARLGWATVDAPELNADRRCQNDDLYGPDHRDPALTVVRFDEALPPHRPIAALVHLAMHATALGGANTLISTDAPGAIERFASERIGIPVLFLQGAAGDVGPGEPPEGATGLQHVEWLGRMGARFVQEAFERAAPFDDRPVLTYAERAVALTRQAIGYQRGEFAEHGAVGCLLGILSCRQYTPPKEAICVPLARGAPVQTSVAALRIGEVLLLTLPGEPTTAIGARAAQEGRSLEGISAALAVGYAQDHWGYLLEEEDFFRGGYEPTVAPWGWKLGDYLLSELRALLDTLHEEQPLLEALVLPEPSERTPDDSFGPAEPIEQPADIERLDAVAFAFFGGDPALGTPSVTLERDGAPVAAQLLWRYQAAPTWAESPLAATREHRWKVFWETAADTPLGRYRFVAQGRIKRGGAVSEYRLESATFEVRASTRAAFRLEAFHRAGRLELVARFPPNEPQYANGGDPVAHWTLRDLDEPPHLGARVAGGRLNARVVTPAGEESVELAWDESARAYVAPEPGPVTKVKLDAGGLTDGWGNVNGRSVEAEVLGR